MTPLETTKEMLAGLGLTDSELEEIRDTFDILAEIVVDGAIEKRKENKHG